MNNAGQRYSGFPASSAAVPVCVDVAEHRDIDEVSRRGILPDLAVDVRQIDPLSIQARPGLRRHRKLSAARSAAGTRSQSNLWYRGEQRGRVDFPSGRVCWMRLRVEAATRTRPYRVCGSRQLAASPFSPAERGPREGLRATVRFGFNPKKSGPDHAVPVIFPATAESER